MKQVLTDRYGSVAMEFGIIGVVVFTMIFAIFDLGRYAITLHSLEMLAAESARAKIICYSPALAGKPATTCPDPPLSLATMQSLFPFLFLGGLTPTVSTSPSPPHIVTATQDSNFKMFMPFWPAAMNTPSASTILPF